jgi:hypothetical protein
MEPGSWTALAFCLLCLAGMREPSTELSGAALPAHETWPEPEWPRAEPADLGMDPKLTAEAVEFARSGEGSGMIIRYGRLVASWGDLRRTYDLKSTTKSFGSIALGLAIKDGIVRLQDRAQVHHPRLGVPPESNATTGWLEEITLLQLASQTAGFEKPGGYTPLLFRPGTKWDYSDSGPNWLAECLTLAWERDLNAVMFERVFTPLGIDHSDLVWRTNAYRPPTMKGIPRREFGAGIHANVDAMARIGYLMLRQGRWKDKVIIPAEYVALSTRVPRGHANLEVLHPETYTHASRHYGLLWWNNEDGTLGTVPRDAFWSWGLHDSLIVVIPSHDIVMARAGKSWRRVAGAAHYDVLKGFFVPVASSVRGHSDSQEKPANYAYPPSAVFEGISWAPITEIRRYAHGSDNWPITAADDGWLYAAYGDGRGFEPFVERKLSLGLARFRGAPDELHAENLSAPTLEQIGDGASGKKASGLLMVDKVLYLLARNATNSQLAWSADYGQTWKWAEWKFTNSFGCPTFLNYGPNHRGACDDYVYVYSPDSDSAYRRADRMVMARVPREQILQRVAWQFFRGLDAQDQPRWTPDIRQREAVFVAHGRCYRSGISYHEPSRRYLWVHTGQGEDPRFRGGLSVHDAPEPWGPWTTVFSTDTWDVGPGETASFPASWMDPDGQTLQLVFSGDDAFSIRPATLRLRSKRNDAVLRFEKRVLTDRYSCDGVTTGDINRDRHVDIIAGPHWYEGPEFTLRHEFYPPHEFDTAASPTDSLYSFVHDFNRDGWPDILVLGRVHLHQAFWYENPGNLHTHWQKHFAFHRVNGESPPFADVDGDGHPELVAHWNNCWGLIQYHPGSPTSPWKFRPFTPAGEWHHFYHGEGLGDLNRDGRPDLLLNEGWYEQPPDNGAWVRRDFRFAEKGGAQIFTDDVDGDGDQDVITALDAHGWGLAWFEQVKGSEGMTFQRHDIMASREEEARFGLAFSQLHALVMADLDGDGLKDIVTGKRRWAHGPAGDVEPMAAPVVYAFRLTRERGTPRYEPHCIDDASGVGLQIDAADVNADGRVDVLTASKLGVFLFLNRTP